MELKTFSRLWSFFEVLPKKSDKINNDIKVGTVERKV